MTREEAIEILTHNWTRVDNPNYTYEELDGAFHMAIEALQWQDRGHSAKRTRRKERVMTKEEAIQELKEDKMLYETGVCHAGDGTPDGRLLEALNMAIEALKAEETMVIQTGQTYGKSAYIKELAEVVRCKDCVWSKEWNDNQIFCDRILMRLRETDFCSYGERREP